MTIEQRLTKMCFDNGMFLTNAQAVMDLVTSKENEPLFPNMVRRWADNEDEYPSQLLAVLWFGVKSIAVNWIDANVPQAWYRRCAK